MYRSNYSAVCQSFLSSFRIKMSRGFEDLPDELLLMIFSYLSFYDLMKSIQPVCVRWWVLSSEKCLWKTSGVLKWMEDAESQETYLAQFRMITNYIKTLCISSIGNSMGFFLW